MVILRAPLIARTAAVRTALPLPTINATRPFSTAQAGLIPVAALDDGRAAATLTVAIKAGARYQSSSQAGASAALKHWLFQSNAQRSALATIRETELRGGVLSTSISKDHVLLHAGFLPEDTEFFVGLLADALVSPQLHHWEYDEHVVPALQQDAELGLANSLVAGIEGLTNVAYHGKGLGASLFASPTSPLSYDTAKSFIQSRLTTDNVSVAATGISLNKLLPLVQNSLTTSLPSGTQPQPTKPTYFGGDARVPFATHDQPQRFLVAWDASSLVGKPELTVLSHLLGGQPFVKWSKGHSLLSQVSQEVPGAKVNPLLLQSEPSGLFGIQIEVTQATNARIVAQAAYNALKQLSTSVPTERLQAAINQAKLTTAMHWEGSSASEWAATELGSSRSVVSFEEQLDQLQVNASSVSNAVATLLQSTPVTAAVGDVSRLPYAADLS